MIRPLLCFLAAAALTGGCGALPRDPDGTLDRVRTERVFKVGLISSGNHRQAQEREQAFVQRIAAATGARPIVTEGAAESLLTRLEAGDLDLVIGMVSAKSPWMAQVAILRPLDEFPGEPPLRLAPIARNGENAWIMLLEREARVVGQGAGTS
jgi:hypothetical protein